MAELNLRGTRALVASFSVLEKDPRVKRQLEWLVSAGVNVTALGFGPPDPVLGSGFIALSQPSLVERLLTYFFASTEARSHRFALTPEVRSLIEKIRRSEFDFVILNDLDLAGVDEFFEACKESGTALIWDLHEYFPDLGGGLFWKLTQVRYHNWLFSKLTQRNIDSFITVSPDIGELYEPRLGKLPATVVNAPILASGAEEDFEFRPESRVINLVYHGAAGKGRGLFRLITTMPKLRPDFKLTVVATGPRVRVSVLKLWARVVAPAQRVEFRDPVRFDQISKLLREFDLQVLFYHPPHSTNEKFALPNKLFESMAAGLGIVIGDSPSMRRVVEKAGCGVVAGGWRVADLADAINGLQRTKVDQLRLAGLRASSQFGSSQNGEAFLREVHRALTRRKRGSATHD